MSPPGLVGLLSRPAGEGGRVVRLQAEGGWPILYGGAKCAGKRTLTPHQLLYGDSREVANPKSSIGYGTTSPAKDCRLVVSFRMGAPDDDPLLKYRQSRHTGRQLVDTKSKLSPSASDAVLCRAVMRKGL